MCALPLWAKAKAPAFHALSKDTVAVLPLGAVEQHGPHLPMSVDYALVEAVLERAAPLIADTTSVLVLPTLRVAASDEHARHPGTLPDDATTDVRDWTSIAKDLAPVDVTDDPVTVKKRSRDFFWYSPILNDQLRRTFGDLVARPKNREELAHCLSVAFAHDVPVVLRGGGTGNYGQSVLLHGGLIIETTALNRIIEIGEGFVRVEAGALMADINKAIAPTGWEMAMFPSTQDIATVGGFVAGGSSGIGSIANGPLREAGNIIQLKALSVEAVPFGHIFDAEANHMQPDYRHLAWKSGWTPMAS